MFSIIPYGEEALLMNFKEEISLEIHQQVKSYFLYLKSQNIFGITDFIPAYNSLTICYNPDTISFETLKLLIEKIAIKEFKLETTKNIVEIPVCYDVEFGVDLDLVSKRTNMSHQQIIALHTSTPYLVYMLGFAPGFMYLGGLNKKLHVARKETPRLKIAAGSVGLADQQTGIYPLETPGGWQIIGRTPLKLFSKETPSLVQMGDYVKFVSIDKTTFNSIKQ